MPPGPAESLRGLMDDGGPSRESARSMLLADDEIAVRSLPNSGILSRSRASNLEFSAYHVVSCPDFTGARAIRARTQQMFVYRVIGCM